MGLSEKVAYIKGLMEGLEIDGSNKEGKVLLAISELLEEMAYSVEQLEEANDEMTELVDILDHDLGEVEEYLFDDEECGCGHDHHHNDEENPLYEVECDHCHELIVVDDEILDEGSIVCPNCGEEIEFDLEAMDAAAEEKEQG